MTTGAMAYAIMKHFQHISSCQTSLENEEFTKCRSVAVGAQLTINQDLLKSYKPRLGWSHLNTVSYLDGMNHVTYGEFDCLEITVDNRYLISIQLTYRFLPTQASTSLNIYFSLVRIRNTKCFVIAKSHYLVPTISRRINKKNMVPQTLTMSTTLQQGDMLCVTANRPDLIYASSVDNFFSVVSIGNV